MKNTYVKIIMVLTMIIAFGVQGYAQRHRYHRSHGYGYYRPYRFYYAPRGYYYSYPRTVVIERPVYTTITRTTTTSTIEDNAELKLDGVTIERESTNRVHIKGGKQDVTLDTMKANTHVVTTKKGSVTVQTPGNDDVNVTVRHGNDVVGTYTL